jgi:hypothetical protein
MACAAQPWLLDGHTAYYPLQYPAFIAVPITAMHRCVADPLIIVAAQMLGGFRFQRSLHDQTRPFATQVVQKILRSRLFRSRLFRLQQRILETMTVDLCVDGCLNLFTWLMLHGVVPFRVG